MWDIAAFRTDFPEFADTTRYPDAMLNFWAGLASAQVNPRAWGTQTQVGIFLYVAHEITLAAYNVNASGVGGLPGGSSGAVSSKSVGGVSISYDTANSSEQGAGWWNQTSYGRQFYHLVRVFGAGAIQLS